VKFFDRSFSPPSFYLLVSLAAGILVGKAIPVTPYFLYLFIFFFILIVSLYIRTFKKAFIILLCAVFFSVGILSIQSVFYPKFGPDHLLFYTDAKNDKRSPKKVIRGQVNSFTRHYPKRAKFVLSAISIKDSNNNFKSIAGKISLSIYGNQNLPQYGDIIEFKSNLKPVRNFLNPGGFDYVSFMKSKGIHGLAYANDKDIKILEQTHKFNFFSMAVRQIENLRLKYFLHIGSNSYTSGPHKYGSYKKKPYKYGQEKQIMISLMTGKKETLSYDVRDLFSKAGISHLLAISGLHLSIVGLLFYMMFYQILSFFPKFLIQGQAKKTAFLLAVFPVAGYAIFSGFSASTQRALIMAIVIVFSLTCEKEKDIFSSLCVAGILILLLNSAALFSISFQLSFSAVLFIIGGMSVIRLPQWIHKYKIISNLSSIVMVTILAGLGTLPFTAHYFNMVSHVQLFTNIIAIPVTSFIILPLGFIGFAIFSWLPTVSSFLIGLCLYVISGLIRFAQFFVDLPFSWTRILCFTWVEILVFYLCIFCVYFFLNHQKKKAIAAVLAAFILFFLNYFQSWNDHGAIPHLSITSLDIGQGNSALIQTADKKNILVDGGGFSDDSVFDTGRFIIAPFLWQNKIRHL